MNYLLPITYPLSMPFFKMLKFYYVNFGLKAVVLIQLLPKLKNFVSKKVDYRALGIQSYLSHVCKNTISQYKDAKMLLEGIPDDHDSFTIWTMWWQGDNHLPNVIQLCRDSLKKNANGHPIVFLNKDNFRDYVALPSYVVDKINNGMISYTHIADIIRTCVLAEYGGMWIDAGVFVTKPITIPKKNMFFSPKMRYATHTANNNRWTVGCMYCSNGLRLFSFVRDMFYEFLSKEKSIIDYFQLDYTIKLAYILFPEVKNVIDNVDRNNENIHKSRYLFDKALDETRLNQLLYDNTFLSLTYRIPYPMQTGDGNETYYAALLRKYNNNEILEKNDELWKIDTYQAMGG